MMVLFGASLLGCNNFDDNTCEDQMSSASWGKTTALVKYVPRESVIEKALKKHDFNGEDQMSSANCGKTTALVKYVPRERGIEEALKKHDFNGIDTYYIPDPIWLKLAPFDKRLKFIDLFRSKTNSNFDFLFSNIIREDVNGTFLFKVVFPEEDWPLEYRRLAGNDDEQDVNNSGLTPFISMMFPNIEDNFLSIAKVDDISLDWDYVLATKNNFFRIPFLNLKSVNITTDGKCEIVYSDGKKQLIQNFVNALEYLLIDNNSLKSSNPVKYKSENDEKWCCPICYSHIEELKEIIEFNVCKHAFCSECYNRSVVCSLCRKNKDASDKIISLEKVRKLFDDSNFRSLINKEDSRKNFKESAHYSFSSKAIATCIEHGKEKARRIEEEKDREKICNSSIYKGFRKMYSKHKSK